MKKPHAPEKTMEFICELYGYRVPARVGEGSVHLENTASLQQLLAVDTEARSIELVHALKTAYLKHWQETLAVTDASLKVEIWGHIYWEMQGKRLRKLLSGKMFRKMFAILLRPTAWIDCGVAGRDDNRFLWDFLSRRRYLANLLNPQGLLHKQQINSHKNS